jgi:hypothetical protein
MPPESPDFSAACREQHYNRTKRKSVNQNCFARVAVERACPDRASRQPNTSFPFPDFLMVTALRAPFAPKIFRGNLRPHPVSGANCSSPVVCSTSIGKTYSKTVNYEFQDYEFSVNATLPFPQRLTQHAAL